MSFTKDAVSSLIDSDQTKVYVDTAVKSTVPTLVQFGLGFAVPFLSPVIIAASSHLVLKGLEIAGDKIRVADDKIEQYKEQPGTKGFLAKMASPALGLLKKVFPSTEKELYEALTDSTKLKRFFTTILENPNKRQEFEENLKKFLTGNYGDFEEFQRNVKETLGINVDRLALEAYTEFTGIIYNTEILNKIISLSNSSEEDRRKIEDSIKEIHKDFKKKYNEIKIEIISLRDTFYVSNGLYRVTPNYFEDYADTEQDMERWKNGFSFSLLSSIKENKEFRRDKIVKEIKKRLEEERRQLIVGGSGTSKSTVLMEIICDYYDEGYEILWNRGDTTIVNGLAIITFIEKLLNDGNKVLVAVDNVHDERRSAIFYAMDQLSSHSRSENVRFILTARLPEYDLLVDPARGLIHVPVEYRESIQYFRDQSDKKDSNLKYEIPFFTKDEIKGFIGKYREEIIPSIAREEKLFDEMSEKIYKYTKGHPIMVKFSIFGNGLRKDVEDRYLNYLIDRHSKLPDPLKVQTILVCSLLDIAGLQISDKLLSDMKIKQYAQKLTHSLIYYNKDDDTWKTIHPRWDIELLSFLYNTESDDNLGERQNYLKNSIDFIFNVKNEQMSDSVIRTLYDMAAVRIDGVMKIPIDVVENVIQNSIETSDYLRNETKSNLYATVIAYAYGKLKRPKEAMDYCNKAIKIDPNNIIAWFNKGTSYIKLAEFNNAIDSFDKAIEIKQDFVEAWNSKGLVYYELEDYKGALDIFDKSLEIKPDNAEAWNYKGSCYQKLGYYDGAMDSYLQALVNRRNYVEVWNKVGNLHFKRGNYKGAISCYDESLEIKPDDAEIWNNKGGALLKIGDYKSAIDSFDKALGIKQDDADIWNNKGLAYGYLGDYKCAIDSFDKALEIKQDDADIWNNKGNALNSLGRYEEAIVFFDKALGIDPENIHSLYNKGWTLVNLGKHEEAIVYIHSLYNKGNALSKMGKYEESIVYFTKALEIDPYNITLLNDKGNSLVNLRRFEEAIACYDKALEVDSNRVDITLYNKGWALLNSGKFEEAIVYFDKALEINSIDVKSLNNKGLSLVNLGNYEEAIKCYDKALEIDPENIRSLNDKGNTLKALKKYEEAIKCYDKALEIEPMNVYFWNNKGIAFYEQEKYEEAIKCYDKALEIDPNNNIVRNSKSFALRSLRK